MDKPTTKQAGSKGEQIAMKRLVADGFSIVEMNYRYGRGEIDIVARDGETLVFCEVKMRENDEYGDPAYAITPRKQKQIRKIALGYLTEHEIHEQLCRFDVVTIKMKGKAQVIDHIKDAF